MALLSHGVVGGEVPVLLLGFRLKKSTWLRIIGILSYKNSPSDFDSKDTVYPPTIFTLSGVWVLRHHVFFSRPFFSKGDNLCDNLFASMDNIALSKCGQLLMERICSIGANSFHKELTQS